MDVELDPLGSLENQTSAIQALNENFERIEEAFDDTVSRTEGRPMLTTLDMNGQRLINLPSPVGATDPARLVDLQTAVVPEGLLIPSLVGNEDKALFNDGLVLYWSSVTGNYVLQSANLSDLDDIAAARTNLGLGTAAQEDIEDIGRLSDNVTRTGTTTFTGTVQLSGAVNHTIPASPPVLTQDSIGFRGIPLEAKDADYTFVLGDAGKSKIHTSVTPHTYTIPTNAAVPYPLGTVLVVDVSGTASVTIARAPGVVLRKAGVATDANATVSQWGSAVIRKLATDAWVVTGTGVT